MAENLHEIDQKLWELTRWLTLRGVPYHPPLQGKALESMKAKNPVDYKKLKEYQHLDTIYRGLTEESI